MKTYRVSFPGARQSFPAPPSRERALRHVGRASEFWRHSHRCACLRRPHPPLSVPSRGAIQVFAMIASLSHLFRRPRVDGPAWIEVVELQRRLAVGDGVVLVDVRQPEEFTAPPGHLPGAVNVPLADLTRSDRRTCRPATTDRIGLQNRSPLCSGSNGATYRGRAEMSPSFVAEQTSGIAKDWLWNSGWRRVFRGRKSQDG